ncbi:MAG TPA: Mov34/MPN/PAD-1 family protein [Anaerolineae bacterium]|nr:Mov34/MPN/PAD-1 family protein [Anaerolineae bacterium]
MPTQLILSPALWSQIINHLTAHYPQEACGFLAGTPHGHIQRHYPIPNIAPTPTTHYQMSPPHQIKAWYAIHTAQLTPLAIYHSHPHSPPIPSPTDITHWTFPQLAQIIISLAPPAPPQAQAYHYHPTKPLHIPLSLL